MDIPHIRRHRNFEDNRGRSSRVFEQNELSLLKQGESYTLMVTNPNVGTLRGMHMDLNGSSPKLVTVLHGAIFDLCVDMRDFSPSKGQVYLGTLRATGHQTLVIPPGFLHGYQVLEPNSTLLYALDEDISSGSANNFNPISPSIVKHWPCSPGFISEADLDGPNLYSAKAVGLPFLVLEDESERSG